MSGLGLAVRLQLRKAHQIVLGLKVRFFVDDPVRGQDVFRVSLAHKPNVKVLENLFHCPHWLSRAVLEIVDERPQVLERNRMSGLLRVEVPQQSHISPEFDAKPSHKPAVLVRQHFFDNELERVYIAVLLLIFLGLLFTRDGSFRETVCFGLDSRNNLLELFVQLLHHLLYVQLLHRLPQCQILHPPLFVQLLLPPLFVRLLLHLPHVQLLHLLVLGALVDHRLRGGEGRSKRGSSVNFWRDFG